MRTLTLVFCLGLLGCQNNARVVTGNACTPLNCGGCCDDRGMCVEGKSLNACGLEGVSCVACSFGAECTVGECLTPKPADSGMTTTDAGKVIPDGGSSVPDAGGMEVDAGHTSCPPDGWCLDGKNASGTPVTTAALRSVWAISATNVWAVGDQGTVIHYDGTAWTQLQTGANDDFSAVWASGPNDVWVAGGYWSPTMTSGVLLRFNGSTWTTVKRGPVRLNAIWGTAANDVWMVGDSGAVQHWDGAALQSFPTNTTLDLVDISGVSKTQIYVAGASGLLLSWDGTAWSTVPTGGFGGLTSVVAFSPTLAWVMGGNGQFLRYDGTNWSSSNLGMNHNVLGLWASSPTQGWGVGPAGELVAFDGVSLRDCFSPSTELLRDVHGSDGSHVWAVGFKGTVLRFEP
jgi:hypothetical protein